MDDFPEFFQNNIETPNLNEQLPLLIRQDARNLVELLEDYYRFLNDDDNPSNIIQRIIDEHDIDKVVDSDYLDRIQKEIATLIPTSPYVQKAFLLKRIIDSYGSRGTKESVLYFFRVFYNEDVTIYNPWERVLIPSQGKWTTEFRTHLVLHVGDESILTNNTLQQYDDNGVLRASIEIDTATKRVFGDRFYFELVLREDTLSGTFSNTFDVRTSDGNARGRLLRTLKNISISDGGEGYSVGDRLYLGGKENVTFQATVSRVDENGKIVSVTTSDPGVSSSLDYKAGVANDSSVIPNLSTVYLNGRLYCIPEDPTEPVNMDPTSPDYNPCKDYYFQTDSTITDNTLTSGDTVFPVNDVDVDTDILSRYIDEDYNPEGGNQGYTLDITGTLTSNGLEITHAHQVLYDYVLHDFLVYDQADIDSGVVVLDYSTTGRDTSSYDAYGEETKVYDIVIQSNKVITFDSNGDPENIPEFELEFDTIYETNGFYSDERGRPSGYSVLQDSFYYQVFSYEVNTTLSIDDWKSDLEDLIHPAGFKLFGRVNSETEATISEDLTGEIAIDTDHHPINYTVNDGVDITSSVNMSSQTYNYDDPYLYGVADPYLTEPPYTPYLGQPYFEGDYTATGLVSFDVVYDAYGVAYDAYGVVMSATLGAGLGLETNDSEYDPYYAPTNPYGDVTLTMDGTPLSGTGYYRRDGSSIWEEITF
jgi:hypothetical protein